VTRDGWRAESSGTSERRYLARFIREGTHDLPSDVNWVGVPAGPGRDGATGSGLVDAAAAFVHA
jgi:hypothetical protein